MEVWGKDATVGANPGSSLYDPCDLGRSLSLVCLGFLIGEMEQRESLFCGAVGTRRLIDLRCQEQTGPAGRAPLRSSRGETPPLSPGAGMPHEDMGNDLCKYHLGS